MRIMLMSEMLEMLRYEARLSTNAAHGVHLTPGHRSLLRRVQEELYDAYDWPHLKTTQDTTLAASDRYATYPSAFTFDGVEGVHAKDATGDWTPLAYGVGFAEYNDTDSEAGEQDFPVRRWQNYFSTDAELVHQNMFEVWPVPDQTATLRFVGKRALFPLTADGHSSTLDGPLIVLHAAVELLAAQKAEDATLKLQKAQARMDLLKKRQTAPDNRPINMSRPSRGPRLRYGIDYVD